MIAANATVTQTLAQASERLARAGCETPRVDAEILVAHALDTTRAGLYAHSRRALTGAEDSALQSLLERRARREPLAYVLGEWGFRRLLLHVDERVLVPRPETEVVVGRCLDLLRSAIEPRVLDVGTGSGAIALAIADEHPDSRVTAIDSSSGALAVARANARRTELDVELVLQDLYDGLPEGPWDLVVSNPPYVSKDEIERLDPEVRDWEPRAALVGEGATEAVAGAAHDVLVRGGALVLEVAEGDAGRVAALLGSLDYGSIRTTRDLAGRDRVVEGLRR
jgi:release factor glutamine methyltransferase